MRAFLIAGLLLLSACSGASLDSLRQAEPKGTPFQQALSAQYLAFSQQEASRYDWWSSQYFAEKGLSATYGNDVQPEELDYWKPDIRHREDLNALGMARGALMERLSSAAGQGDEQLAKAQVYFDCWVEESSELGDSSSKGYCRDQFESIIGGLPAGSPPTAASSKGDHNLTAADVSISYLVYFDWNSDHLSQDAIDILQIILTDLHNIDEYEIVINGHTDSSGSQEYNMELSQRRANSVQRWLTQSGIASNLISLFAFGETDPKEPTSDGARNKTNRRVEIFIE